MIPNAADPKQIEAASLRSDLSQDQADSDLAWILADAQGRRFLYRILGIAGIYRNPFDSDHSIMAANCGQMNVGLQLLSEIQRINPEGYLLMLKERIESVKRDTDTIAASHMS